MSISSNPASDADAAQQALRALAHATRSIDDPSAIYAVLGSLSCAVASMSQSLHQIAACHDFPRSSADRDNGAPRGARRAAGRDLVATGRDPLATSVRPPGRPRGGPPTVGRSLRFLSRDWESFPASGERTPRAECASLARNLITE